MSWLLAPYADARTYRIAAYFVLGLFLGVLDFTLVVTGLSLGLGLLVTVLGIPILLATLLVARALATLERRLAWSLLDAPFPRRRTELGAATGFSWRRLKSLAGSRRTYAELAFLTLRLPMGVLDFSFVTTVVALALAGLGYPLMVLAGVDIELGAWTIDGVAEALIIVPVSVVFVLVGPRLIIGWSTLSRRLAATLLGTIDTGQLKREVAGVLSEQGESDAFGIFEQLTRRLGRGPFLTATRVEAALLALQSSGRVTARHIGTRTTYTLA